jgi:peptide-methionine (S)-S-oxide reductase
MERATFGAGCFWGVEANFRRIPGVKSARVGYAGGSTEDPGYEEVCTGRTGHAEVVEVEFDPEIVSYEQILDVFFGMHDPTTPNRQGPDIGSQYRSLILTEGPDQDAAARRVKRDFDAGERYSAPIVTEIAPAGPFYPAEEYHQRYFEKHGISH